LTIGRFIMPSKNRMAEERDRVRSLIAKKLESLLVKNPSYILSVNSDDIMSCVDGDYLEILRVRKFDVPMYGGSYEDITIKNPFDEAYYLEWKNEISLGLDAAIRAEVKTKILPVQKVFVKDSE
jgi:hypothetical protein